MTAGRRWGHGYPNPGTAAPKSNSNQTSAPDYCHSTYSYLRAASYSIATA